MENEDRVEYLASLTLVEWKDDVQATAQVTFYQGQDIKPLHTIRRTFTFDRVKLSECDEPEDFIRELLISAIECL